MSEHGSPIRSSRPNYGFARQFFLGALAIALMGGGIALALRSMDVDHEIRQRYEDALAMSEHALQAQQLGSDLRAWQIRMAGRLTGQSMPDGADIHVDDLQLTSTALKDKALEIAQHGGGAAETAELARIEYVLDQLERLNARLLQANQQHGLPLPAAIELAEQSNHLSSELENALTRLVAAGRARTEAAARRAAEFSSLARIGLIAFSGVTLALALLLVVLTARTMRANRILMSQLEHAAREDPLTGVTNRRGLDDGLSLEFARALRTGQPLALVMIDLDHFKRYNDRRGHGAGDALLRKAAQAWLKLLRPTDLLARYGGEEFTLLLPGCQDDAAAQLVDRLRLPMPDHQTFSAGIATWDGIETAPELLQRADQALLQAKKSGRNRTMIAGREPQATLPLKVA